MPLRVNIVNGETVLRQVDLRLPGYVPLVLARVYRSGREQSGEFGHGWRLNWRLTLRAGSEEIVYAPDTPHETHFAPPDEGMQARHATGVLIQHAPDAYAVVPAPSRRLVFDKAGAGGEEIPLSRIEDPNGNGVHFFYHRGNLAGIVDTVGREVRLEYQGGQVSRLYLESGDASASTVRTFRYSGQGDLVEERDADGGVTSYRYQRHLMTEHTLRDGGTHYAQYDGDRRCRALWHADGSEARRFFYDASRRRTRVVGGGGRQTLYQHVQPGRVLARTDPLDRTQNYYYDDALRLIGFSNEHAVVQTLQQLDLDDGTGTFLDAEERSATFEVNDDLRVTAVLDSWENRHTLTYDDHDRVTQFRTPSGREWTFQRDERGGVREVTGPMGGSVRLTRAADGQTLVVEDDHGRRTEEHFDEYGRLIERVGPLQRRFQWQYDANGRLRQVRAGRASVEFEYSPGGAPTRIVDAEEHVTEMRRDAFGRLRECIFGGDSYRLDYDAAGRITSVQDPRGATTKLVYGEGGRLAKIRHGDGRATTYDHGEEGTKVLSGGGNGSTQGVYNQAGAPVRWQKPGQPEYVLEYGPVGELLGVEGEEQSLFFDYDEERRVVEATKEGESVRVEYGEWGGIQAVHRGERVVVEAERDSLGRPIKLNSPSRTFELVYDEGDRLNEIRRGGDSWTLGYDAFGRPADVQGPRGPDEKICERKEGQTYVLHSSNQELREKLRLHTTRRGIALSLNANPWCVPIWQQGDCLRPRRTLSPSLVAATLTLGDEPLVEPIRSIFTPRLPRRWRQPTERGIRWDYAEIPRPATLGRTAWSLLDRFFLDRSFYELGAFSLRPDERAGRARGGERPPDPRVTGPHFTGELRPSLWTNQAAGPHLRHQAPGPPPAPTSPLDVLELIRK
jgi:YD repeat-containing protein